MMKLQKLFLAAAFTLVITVYASMVSPGKTSNTNQIAIQFSNISLVSRQ